MEVKKVILHGKSARSRRGAYYRVREGGVTRFYKVRKDVKTKAAAQARFNVNKAKRLIDKKEELPKKKAEEEFEEARLHFRADYNKSGHEIIIKDSYVSTTVPKGMSDAEVQALLTDLFEEAVAQDFGAPVLQVLDVEMISGLERGQGSSEDRVVINYQHGKGGGRWRHIEKPVEKIRAYKTDEAEFLSDVKKRMQK